MLKPHVAAKLAPRHIRDMLEQSGAKITVEPGWQRSSSPIVILEIHCHVSSPPKV